MEDVGPMFDNISSWKWNGFSPGKCEHQHDLQCKYIGSSDNKEIMQQFIGLSCCGIQVYQLQKQMFFTLAFLQQEVIA
jgi:hypothetical protein